MKALRRRWHRIRGKHSWKFKETFIGADSGDTYGPWLICNPCNEFRVLDREPPLGHPDSMTTELPRKQEEWLAAVDAELWHKETA